MKKEKIRAFAYDKLTEDEYTILRNLRRRNKSISNPSKYKIIITSEKKDYDNLMEYAEHPEHGERIATFYFNNPDQLDLICKAYEGLFYQLFRLYETKRIGYGIIDGSIFEDLSDEKCCRVCSSCFSRKDIGGDEWGCIKIQ